MGLILFTFGLFLKTVYTSYNDYRKNDVITIILAVTGAVLVALYAHFDAEPGDKTALVVLPIVYVCFIAFTSFKSRLLPVVTESTMLVYGLIGAYFYFQSGLEEGRMASASYFYGLLLFLVYLCLAIALVASSLRLSKFFQASCMVMFLMMSIYISLNMLPATVVEVHPVWAMVMGFSCLSLLANILYIVYLIPIPAKGQTIANRIQKIAAHLSDFEKNYHDDDTVKQDILLIVCLLAITFTLEFFTTLETFVIVAIVLTLVELMRRKKEQLVEFQS